MAFTSLNHYLDLEWMRYAYECVRKDGAVAMAGDGQVTVGNTVMKHGAAKVRKVASWSMASRAAAGPHQLEKRVDVQCAGY